MSRRAARAGDQHVCPSKDPKPHLGGPVQRGFARVLIEGTAAARAGDMATCRGATDVISEGSGTVKIGGMHAARRGDGCVHGGSITGAAGTVLIGGPTVSPPGIAAIARNAAEIDRLRQRQAERRDKIRKIDAYLKRKDYEQDIPAVQKGAEKILKKIIDDAVKRMLEKQFGTGQGLPPGAGDFSEQEAKTASAAADFKKDLEKGIERDEQRIRELEKENGERASGKDVRPTPPVPDLDKPIKAPPPISNMDED
ncbi:MAG: PAAR domain-containing protein [Polyangiaceae bacterium]